MAINDIKISQFPEIPSGSVTDDVVIPVEKSGSNFKLSMLSVKKFCKFLLTDEPLITDNALTDEAEFLVKAVAQSKVTLLSLMTYIKANIPKIIVPTRGSLRLSTTTTQALTDDATAIKLTCFDEGVTERGDILIDDTEGTIKYLGSPTSTAILTMGLNVSFPATESLELFLFKNDVVYSTNPLVLTGDGTTDPTETFWQSDIPLAEDDVLDIRGRNGKTGSFTITYLRATFRLDVD